MCFNRKPVKYVETYRGWIIAEFKMTGANQIQYYVAVDGSEYIRIKHITHRPIVGRDLPDLRADIDEAMR
jgi:hypothetical protein